MNTFALIHHIITALPRFTPVTLINLLTTNDYTDDSIIVIIIGLGLLARLHKLSRTFRATIPYIVKGMVRSASRLSTQSQTPPYI